MLKTRSVKERMADGKECAPGKPHGRHPVGEKSEAGHKRMSARHARSFIGKEKA